jgi:serine/threonine-protein kinase
VVLAFDNVLQTDVALAEIKLVNEEGLYEVLREAQLNADVSEHPAIVSILDVFTRDKSVFLVQEYMSGGNLASMMHSQLTDVIFAMATVERLAAAIDFAHSKELPHCDIKPANIVLDSVDRAYLTDFGLATRNRLNNANLLRGTPAYMAPEQLFGKMSYASDIFSLGCVLYEMADSLSMFASRKTQWQKNQTGSTFVTGSRSCHRLHGRRLYQKWQDV